MTPIYTETAAYAKSVGELDLYRVSLHENKNCKNAIDKAISENFDGFRLKKDCYKPVIEQFGQERLCISQHTSTARLGWAFLSRQQSMGGTLLHSGRSGDRRRASLPVPVRKPSRCFGWIHQPDAPRTGKAEILRSGLAEKCRFPIQRSSAEPKRD